MRVAVIDCGTNTIRLLITDGNPDGTLTEVTRELKFVRLGQGVDATGRFDPAALERTFLAVEDYARIIADSQVDKVRFVATSAARDVSNREEFFEGVRSRLGVTPDVISGQEEAELSFLGALAGGPLECGPQDGVIVVDIGGGSTEVIRGTASGTVMAEKSLDMGSVRIRERFLHHDPPTAEEVSAARQFVTAMLDGCEVPLDHVSAFVGVAGTTTSLSAMYQGLVAYDRARVHNSVLPVDDIEALSDRLFQLSVAQAVEAYPSLPLERAEVICAGALICAELARRIGRPMIVRETDILDGAALKLVRG